MLDFRSIGYVHLIEEIYDFIRYSKKVGSVPEVPSKCKTHKTAHLILLLANYMYMWGIII